jgi:hypothetical protein
MMRRTCAFHALILAVLCGLAGCGAANEKVLRQETADNLRHFQEQFAKYPATSVLKTMNGQVVAALQQATPKTLRNPVMAAAGIQHVADQGMLFVFWICAKPRGDAIEIRPRNNGPSLILSLPPEYVRVNRKESSDGSLRMRAAFSSANGSPELKAILETVGSAGDYEVALREHGRIVSEWIGILEMTSPTTPGE